MRFDRSKALPSAHLRGMQVRALALIVAGICMFLVTSHGLLSSRYNADSDKIQAIAQGRVQFTDDKAFTFIGDMYGDLGLANHATMAGLLGFFFFVVVACYVLRIGDLGRADLLLIAGLTASLLFAALYLGQYSKDVLVLFVTLAIGGARRGGVNREILVVALMIGMALYVRSYWILILGAYLAFRWALRRRHGIKRLALETIVIYIGLAIVFQVALHQDLDYGRTTVNASRLLGTIPVRTIINDPVPIHGFSGGLANSIVMGAFLAFPLPLAKAGVFYMAVAALVASMWISVVLVLRKYVRAPEISDPVIERSLAVIFAMLLIQSLFEPDYGSYVRHLTPLMPLMILVPARWRALAASPSVHSLEAGAFQ